MPSPYSKPFLDIAGQIALLQTRGMTISDIALATAYLSRIGYYRLSGYWYPFRHSTMVADARGVPRRKVLDTFQAGTEFKHAVDLYVFDKKLRLLVLDAIERIEVCLRVEIAILLGAKDRLAHHNPAYLSGRFITPRPGRPLSDHSEWLARLTHLESRSKAEFVAHFSQKYSGPIPIWMSIELWDFGLLSKFYAGMKNADQIAISSRYSVSNPQVLVSWLRSINYIRNVCAHHSRLWNLSIVDQPQLPATGIPIELAHVRADQVAKIRLYGVLAIVQFMLSRINPTSSWRVRLASLVNEFPGPAPLSMANAGFPTSWSSEALWR